MSTITPATAHHFLSTIDLPESPTGFEAIHRGPVIDFDAQKNQAMVVASDILSFVKGVSAERRQDIANSSLLAQLAATRRFPTRPALSTVITPTSMCWKISAGSSRTEAFPPTKNMRTASKRMKPSSRLQLSFWGPPPLRLPWWCRPWKR